MDCGAGIRKAAMGAFAISSFLLAGATANAAQATTGDKKPNILFIMGDDVGWFNIGAYHQGMMSGKTPNLDKLASQGMRFTDYYAEASCTAGRANFITGELPIRTGLTTVGQAGADVGLPAEAVTLATVLKAQGYVTGQFGKNHLGDLNKYLPCVHGFDEFFGYLYHLDAMSDPYWFDYPQDWIDKTGPRNLVHCFAAPTIVNIRQDPFERTPAIRGETTNNGGLGYMMDFYAREFWRFVNVQQLVGKLAQSAIEFPPMQARASFNLDAIKAKVEEAIKAHEGQ
jgi:arylsulfatase A-like enzyme